MNFIKKYLWAFEIFGAVVILAFGVYTQFNNEIVLFIIGLALIVYNLLRIVPLVKTTKDKLMKFIFLFEFVFNIAAGFYLIWKGRNADESTKAWLFVLVGAVLYIRGLIHFLATSVRKEPSDYVKFFVNIGFVTLGVIIAVGKIKIEYLAWILLVFAFLSALFIALNATKNYKNYRYEMLAKEETKRINKKDQKTENKIDDPKPVKEDQILPEKEEKKEEAVL